MQDRQPSILNQVKAAQGENIGLIEQTINEAAGS
jgi:hypothetical protein